VPACAAKLGHVYFDFPAHLRQDNSFRSTASICLTIRSALCILIDMDRTPQLTRRPDCSTLHALQASKLPLAEFIAACTLHYESQCAECAAIAASDAILEQQASAEPACDCRQTDVDMFDPRGCEVHDGNSPWNVRLRAL
jgi:hypothetical protein